MDVKSLNSLLASKRIIVYGAGKIGRHIASSLKYLGYDVNFFWDINHDKINENLDFPVFEPDFDSIPKPDRCNYVVVTTIFSETINNKVSNSLRKSAYIVLNDKKEINFIIKLACTKLSNGNFFKFNVFDCHSCPLTKTGEQCNIFLSNVASDLATGVDYQSLKKNALILPKIGLIISNKCNLKCKNCNHLRYLYKEGDSIDFSADELLSYTTKIVDASDLIVQLTVVGGEPFIHPQIYEILDRLLCLPKVGYIQLITNGTIIPRDKSIFNLLSNKRIIVEISGYGNMLSSSQQASVSKFINSLIEHNVQYLYIPTLQWFDFGDLKYRSYSKTKHKIIYNTCCFVSNDLFNGKLHKCSRSVFASYLGLIPDFPSDYVDLKTKNSALIRKNLKTFIKINTPSVCQYCNGTSTPIDVPGAQR